MDRRTDYWLPFYCNFNRNRIADTWYAPGSDTRSDSWFVKYDSQFWTTDCFSSRSIDCIDAKSCNGHYYYLHVHFYSNHSNSGYSTCYSKKDGEHSTCAYGFRPGCFGHVGWLLGSVACCSYSGNFHDDYQ